MIFAPGTRIMMTTDTVGGVWTYALELTRALLPFNVEVALATMGAPLSGPQQRAASSLHNLKIQESNFRLEWMEDPWDDVRASAGRAIRCMPAWEGRGVPPAGETARHHGATVAAAPPASWPGGSAWSGPGRPE